MKPIFTIVSLLFLCPMLLFSDLTENRTFPRIVKAENMIAKGENDKAMALLEEVIDIDAHNQKALKMLVLLCTDKKNFACVQRYSEHIKDKDFASYYRANAFYTNKEYAHALETINHLDLQTLSSQKQFHAALLALKSSIFLGQDNDISTYLAIVAPFWKRKEHLQSFYDVTTLFIDHRFYMLGMKQIEFAQKHMIDLNNEILINWAYQYQKAYKYEQALSIIEEIENPKIRYDKKILILSEMDQPHKAAKEMEKLYALDSTEDNRERLLYLYDKANMTQEKEKLYRASLETTCDASALRSLLKIHPSGIKREALLEQYVPFPCLDKTERFNLALELFEIWENKGQITQILTLLDTLSHLQDLSSDQLKILSFWYAKTGEYNKAATLMEKVYHQQPNSKNRERLAYLYEKNQDEKKIEALHITTLQKSCNRESLLFILSKHNNFDSLKKYFPYSCLKPTEQFNYTIDLVKAYTNQNDLQNALHILDSLAKHGNLTSREYHALAIEYAALKQKRKSRKYTHKAYESNPNDLYAIKQLAYDYEQNNQPLLAIKYYQKALALDPKDIKLYLALGSLYAKVDKPQKALYYWDKYRLKHRTDDLILLSAEQAMHVPDVQRAQRYLDMLPSIPKKKELAYRYYILKSQIAHKNNQPDKQRFYYKKAMIYNPYKGALYYADLGYMYYEDQNYTAAAKAFEKALSYKKTIKYNDQLGYTYEKLGEHEKAIKTFKASIDMINTMPQPNLLHRYKLKQEIDNSRSFSGYLAYTSRLDNYTIVPTSTAIPQSSYNGFALLELSYKPQIFKSHLFFYARGLSAVENKSLDLEDQTWQPSIGVRYKPFEDQLLTFSLEHLFKGGRRSREDTMIRAETAFFDDYHFHPVETEYWYKNLYLSTAYYIEDDIYSLYANYEHGYMMKLGYKQAIMPYVSTSASAHNDNYWHDQIKNIDIGAGLSLFFWWNEREYRPHQFSGRLSIEGRKSLYHTLDDEKTIRMKFELFF